MAEDETPSKPAPEAAPASGQKTSPQPAAPAKATAPAPAYDEFSSARRNLPPAAPVAIAIVLVAVVVAILAYVNRAKPVAQGSVDGVWFSQPANMSSPMILIEVTVRNVGEKTLYIKTLKADVVTDQGDQSDEATSATDYDRYLMAYPDLHGHARPLQVETKIPSGGELKGAVMVSLPITQAQFDARKDLAVTIEPYDQRPIVLHEKSGAAK